MCTVSNPYPVLSKLTLNTGFSHDKACSLVYPSDSRISGVYVPGHRSSFNMTQKLLNNSVPKKDE